MESLEQQLLTQLIRSSNRSPRQHLPIIARDQ